MKPRTYTDNQLKEAVSNSSSLAGVLRALGLRQTGGGHRHLKVVIQKLGIDTTHLRGQGWNKGLTSISNSSLRETGIHRRKYTNQQVFLENSPIVKGSDLKRRLLMEGWEYKCSECGLKEWQGKHIALHLHHKNGIHTDNRRINLCFLCPNCHQQTDNWGSKNANRDVVERQTHSVEIAAVNSHESSSLSIPTKEFND